MKKRIFILLLALVCLCGTACGEGGAGAGDRVTVYALSGPTGVGMVHLMEAHRQGQTAIDYDLQLAYAPDEPAAKLISGDCDIAAIPTNLAATLYNKTKGGVQVLALNTLGVLYLLQNGGEPVTSVADLRGRTVYSTGQGANPEYILRYLLTQNGLDPDKDVHIAFVAENTELIGKIAGGQAELALLPEPAASVARTKNAAIQTVLDCTEEWARVTTDGSRLTMGCVAVRTAFAAQHPDRVAQFLREYETSLQKAQQADVAETARLCVQFGVLTEQTIAETAIPRCNLCYCAGAEMKQYLSGFLQVLYRENSKSVGGALPDEDFYYGA